TRYLGILQDASAFPAPQLQGVAATHVHDLLALALGSTCEAVETANCGLRVARLQSILAEITTDFADPRFSLADIAKKLGISARYVQDVLHDTGRSFTKRVTELRLRKARAILRGARKGSSKIIDIAY